MLRITFFIVLLFHGLLHLPGFAKAWNLAPVPQISGQAVLPISASMTKVAGVLWLLACVGFVTAAAAFLFKKDGWWIWAAAAMILSQLLLFLYWPDAKAGTIVNIIVLAGILPVWANRNFDRMVRREVQELLQQAAPATKEPVTADQLKDLPPCVQNWLTHSGIIGKPRVHTVRLRQSGSMRIKPGGDWMPVSAEQYFNADEPGFIWTVAVDMPPGIPIAGRDKFYAGKGNMLIKAFSLIPFVNGLGNKIDQGSQLRFLGEMIWFPSAALNPYIRWEPVDSLSARATMSWKGLVTSAIFTFDARGDFRSMQAERYMGSGEKASLEQWYIPPSEWKEMAGVRIPVKGDVIWKLATGDFDYYRWEITELEYDPGM